MKFTSSNIIFKIYIDEIDVDYINDDLLGSKPFLINNKIIILCTNKLLENHIISNRLR